MGKGKRIRREVAESLVPDSAEAIRQLDPRSHYIEGRQAHARPDGMPPPELVEEFLEQARSEGCICKPEIVIHKSEHGGGALALMHKGFCPLIRVLDEQVPS